MSVDLTTTFTKHGEGCPAENLGGLPFLQLCIKLSNDMLLEYNANTKALVTFTWPADFEAYKERLHPSRWSDYRSRRAFTNPGCLCAALDPHAETNTETLVFPWKPFPSRDRVCWAARCVTGRCRYFVLLDRFFANTNCPTKVYPLRPLGDLPSVLPETPFNEPWYEIPTVPNTRSTTPILGLDGSSSIVCTTPGGTNWQPDDWTDGPRKIRRTYDTFYCPSNSIHDTSPTNMPLVHGSTDNCLPFESLMEKMMGDICLD